MIRDLTTKRKRIARGLPKDLRFNEMLRDISYKTEGELFLISLKNSAIDKLKRSDYYKVEMV